MAKTIQPLIQQTSALIVEDQPNMRQVVRKVLKHIGLNDITEAPDGLTALNILRDRNSPRPGKLASPDGPIDIVICDWNMPSMTGVELLREVRKDAALAKITFCMLTGENERYSIMEAIEHGANEYIVKPFSTNTLEDKLRKILDGLVGQK